MRSVLIDSHQPSLYIDRLPIVSKYCWVWRSGASASVSESANVTPCIGCCSIPSMCVGIGMPAMSRIVGPTSMTWVKCVLRAPSSLIRLGPVDDERVARAAEVRADLLSPLERRVARPRPGGRVVRRHHLVAPRLDAAVALGELQLHLVGQRDAVLHRQLVEGAGDRALHAGAVVAPDPEHERVVELAELVDRVEHAADVVVGVLGVAGVDLHLARVVRLELVRDVVPGGERVVARRQLRVGGDHAERLLPGERLLAQLVPALVELALVLRRPLLGHVMRRVAAAGGEVGEERLLGVLRPDRVQPLDRLVRHGVGQVVGVLLVVERRRACR